MVCDERAVYVCLSDSEPKLSERLVIPEPLRRALELEEGDWLVARHEAERLVLEKLGRVKKQLKARFAQVPVERALLDESIAERRAQFCLEDIRPESV